MSQPFPLDPFFSGNYAPISFEADAPDLPLRGELPKELAGTLYRNGPNPQFAPRDANHHWFIGDGMIHAFHVAEGRVSYRNRWVRTPKWELEHKAQRALFGSWGNPATTDPSVQGKDSGVANTNIVCHGGKLFALEEGHRPFSLDPTTLAARGYWDFQGAFTGTRFTAHPKIDPETGEMIFFAYSANGRFSASLGYGIIDRSGKLTRYDLFDAPYASMVHDFMVTRNYVLFPVLPLTGSMQRALSGKPAYAWEADKRSYVGVLKRNADVSTVFSVIAPSLPGYGLSFSPGQPRFGVEEIADCFAGLMTDVLGRHHFGAQGGDWGSFITSRLAYSYPDRLIGIHLNMMPLRRDPKMVADPTSEEQKYLEQLAAWLKDETGYQWIQGTRPQTLAFALTDSPAGLAAWIIEKFRVWSDCGGDLESVFTKDELLANISLYWFTGTIGSSFWPYYARMHRPWPVPDNAKISVPTGYTEFPCEMLRPPRSLASRTYGDIRRWTVMPRGGHFAAMEQPEAMAAEIREFFRPLLRK